MSCELSGYRLRAELQQATNWCWAAIATSVVRFYDPATFWTQPQVVQTVVGSVSNVEGKLDVALATVGRFAPPAQQGRVLFAGCESEVCESGCPVGVAIQWAGTNSIHFVAVIGVSDVDGVPYVTVHDPLPGIAQNFNTLPYDDFISRYLDHGSWQWTYFTI